MTDVKAARVEYLENGYDAIPLKPQSKLPARKAWQTRPTFTQWNNVSDESNIGLRAGNGKAFIDCDDKNQVGTFSNVTQWLEGLGYISDELPIVRTPSGGAHVYVNFSGGLFGSKRNLCHNMGTGEFRYDYGAYVAAPPSVIAGIGGYTLTSGSIDHLPVLDLHDITELVDINATVTEDADSPKMSRRALLIASGTKPDKYSSNSEGEAALILSLINSGFDYQGIKHIFDTFPCLGHYSGKHVTIGDGDRWLYMTYAEMKKFSQHVSPARRLIGEYLEAARTVAWSNANRRKVLVSHLEIAYQAGRFDYAAGVRDIALGAGVHKDTASNQTRKLITEGYISTKQRGGVVSATVYALNTEYLGHSLRALNVRKCPKYSQHDAFRNGCGKYAKGRLGRRAGEIYELLFDNPLTIAEIAKQTGAREKTVENALRKLGNVKDYRTGELIQMVVCEANKWHSVLVDLEVIAAIVRTYGATGKQRAEYEKERRDHRRSLELGTLKT